MTTLEEAAIKQESLRDRFVGVLTFVVTVMYVGAAVGFLWASKIDFKEFSAAIGPIVGLLVGYFVRGSK